MKKLLSLLAFVLLVSIISAQSVTRKFAEITVEEMDLPEYTKDEKAEATVLFDIGESVFFDFEGGYKIRFTRSRRIKINNNKGLNFGEVRIPFFLDGYGKTEEVVKIEAYTYNLVGGKIEKTPLDPTTVYEEQQSNKWKVKKFAFPKVKPGSIIEYQYILETPFEFNLPDWNFQDVIPTLYSRYTARLIPFYEYVFIAQGIKEFDEQRSITDSKVRQFGTVNKIHNQNAGSGMEFQDKINIYVMQDVPAFRDESYITAVEDYIMKIDFQLAKLINPYGGSRAIVSTWPELNERLLKHDNFGKYLNKVKKLAVKSIHPILNVKGKSVEEICKAACNYVKDNVVWNKRYSKFSRKSPKELIKLRSGNSAEINLLYIGILQSFDIDVDPVIVSTRGNGKIKVDYPFDHFFNNVIALVNGSNSFLTDATVAALSYNRIPADNINEKGLVVNNEAVEWVGLSDEINSINKKDLNITIDPVALKANARVSIQSTEYESFNYRNSFEDDAAQIKKSLEAKNVNNISNLESINYEDKTLPYVFSFDCQYDLELIDGKILLPPFLDFPLKENPLNQKRRLYPVDLIYPQTVIYNTKITTPAGYKIVGNLGNFEVEDELVKLSIKYIPVDYGLEVNAVFTNKKSVYPPEDYAKIKHYLGEVANLFNEQVVFERKE